jgi:hypothetical protein
MSNRKSNKAPPPTPPPRKKNPRPPTLPPRRPYRTINNNNNEVPNADPIMLVPSHTAPTTIEELPPLSQRGIKDIRMGDLENIYNKIDRDIDIQHVQKISIITPKFFFRFIVEDLMLYDKQQQKRTWKTTLKRRKPNTDNFIEIFKNRLKSIIDGVIKF